jgi:hypothetical protein
LLQDVFISFKLVLFWLQRVFNSVFVLYWLNFLDVSLHCFIESGEDEVGTDSLVISQVETLLSIFYY